jgi:RND superfamily putative drug exporter
MRYVVIVGVLLGAASLPFLRVEFALNGPEQLPTSFEGRQVVDTLRDRFPGGSGDPIIVVARADADQVRSYAESLARQDGVAAVGEPREESPGLFSLEVQPVGESQGDRAQDLLRDLRADEPGFPTWVTGSVASLVDLKDELVDRGPLALTVIALSALVLLFLMTGSVLIPVKALLMNTLSLGASFGALVLVFQDGYLDDVLGFTSAGRLEVWVPVLAFVFAFGLSMDYEVFMLSRIREQHLAGADNDRAVALGLQHSGRIITSAALLIIVVFAGFAAGKLLGIKALGLAMSIAVLVDATLVRCLLVPATMTLLGRANWWAPEPLRRFHNRFGLREVPETAMSRVPSQLVSASDPRSFNRP